MTLPDFDYNAKPTAKLEIPIGERIAQIRARKAERERASKGEGGAEGGEARRRPAAVTPGKSEGARAESGGPAKKKRRSAGRRRTRARPRSYSADNAAGAH